MVHFKSFVTATDFLKNAFMYASVEKLQNLMKFIILKVMKDKKFLCVNAINMVS